MTQVDPQTQVAENGHWTETGDWVQTGPVHQPVNWESGFLDDAVKRRRVLAGLAVCGGTAAVVGSFAAANKMMGGSATESSWEQALTGSSSDPLAIPRQFVEGMEGSVDVMETALVDPARTGNLAVSLDAAESQGENSQAAGATAPAADGSAPADTMAGDPMAGDPMGDADYGTDYGDDNMDGVMGDDPMDVMDDMAKAAGSILVVDPGQEAPKGTLTPDMESVLETVKPAPPAQPKFDPSGPLVDVGSGSGSTAAAVGRRLSFGLNQQLLQEITAMGPSQWIEDQLSKTTGDAAVDSRLPGKSVGNGPTDQLDGDDIRRNLMHTAVYRARYSRHQLFEMMAWMWADHLTVYHGGKNRSVAVYQETVIRPHAMGKFADMLQASAAATAMIYYLDSQSNNANDNNGLNENYAREVLELHTVGDGNFTEADVDQAARAFSGWRSTGDRGKRDLGRFEFNGRREWAGDITVLGRTFPGGNGAQRGRDLLDYLARRPDTARQIASRIIRRFVSDNPPSGLVASAAQVYLDNDTAIVPVLRHIFNSPEFLGESSGKVRRSFEHVVAGMRALDADVATDYESQGSKNLYNQLSALGQLPWGWTSPDGYPDTSTYWTNTTMFMKRFDYAARLVHNKFAGYAVDSAGLAAGASTAADMVNRLVARAGMAPLSGDEVQTILSAGGVGSGDAASSLNPRQVGDMAAVILCHPLFQVR